MHDVHFNEVIIAAAGRHRVVSSVAMAAEHLSDDWPVKEGPKLVAAHQACIRTMEGTFGGQKRDAHWLRRPPKQEIL